MEEIQQKNEEVINTENGKDIFIIISKILFTIAVFLLIIGAIIWQRDLINLIASFLIVLLSIILMIIGTIFQKLYLKKSIVNQIFLLLIITTLAMFYPQVTLISGILTIAGIILLIFIYKKGEKLVKD
jgi:VIT1/CCC1 family predicted Fe2+/Mn2+ transporter